MSLRNTASGVGEVQWRTANSFVISTTHPLRAQGESLSMFELPVCPAGDRDVACYEGTL